MMLNSSYRGSPEINWGTKINIIKGHVYVAYSNVLYYVRSICTPGLVDPNVNQQVAIEMGWRGFSLRRSTLILYNWMAYDIDLASFSFLTTSRRVSKLQQQVTGWPPRVQLLLHFSRPAATPTLPAFLEYFDASQNSNWEALSSRSWLSACPPRTEWLFYLRNLERWSTWRNSHVPSTAWTQINQD